MGVDVRCPTERWQSMARRDFKADFLQVWVKFFLPAVPHLQETMLQSPANYQYLHHIARKLCFLHSSDSTNCVLWILPLQKCSPVAFMSHTSCLSKIEDKTRLTKNGKMVTIRVKICYLVVHHWKAFDAQLFTAINFLPM